MDISVCPSVKQFWVENLLLIFLIVAMAVSIVFVPDLLKVPLSSMCCAGVFLCLIRWQVLRNYKWTIKQEEIIQKAGWMNTVTDHIEMYRIVDYQETQSWLQRLFSIKTVVLISTDRLNSTLYIKGVPSSSELMRVVRGRVETCKTNKRIYEIANH